MAPVLQRSGYGRWIIAAALELTMIIIINDNRTDKSTRSLLLHRANIAASRPKLSFAYRIRHILFFQGGYVS